MNSQTLDIDWRRIEREARDAVLDAIEAAELAPMPLGTPVAWAECRFGRTDGFSLTHRVGEPFGDRPMSLCGENIPPTIMLLTLTPNLMTTLGRCRYCDDAYVQKGDFAS